MTSEQVLVSNLVAAALVLCVAGVLLRGRAVTAPVFAVYLGFALITNRLVTWWPDAFFNRRFWQWRVATSSALEFLIVLDIVRVAFRRWKHARRLVHAGLVIAVATGAIGGAFAFVSGAPDLGILSWLETAATWSFVALLIVAGRYRLPLHPFHRSMCLGFALYLGLYSAVLDTLAHGTYRTLVATFDPVAFAATVGIWAVAAWRAEDLPDGARRALYPWTARP